MAKLKIEGGNLLTGNIEISGSKNSAVALLPAALLCNKECEIFNVPKIRDIEYLLKILEVLNCKYEIKDDILRIDTTNLKNAPIPEDLSEQMRASYYFMGTLLARFHRAEISFPGGCVIGARPIDLHIKGFEALGAKVTIIKNKYIIEAEELVGTKIHLDFASVGATINLMLASTRAKGETIIENAAREPEIVNVADFLISAGCKITGAGTNTIRVLGTQNLDNGKITVCPDRIEASTYIIMGALIGKNLHIKNLNIDHITSVLDKLSSAGISYEKKDSEIIISKCDNILPTNIVTETYPGFPTDVQPPFVTLLTQANGVSTVHETIYESRFKYTESLKLQGASCITKANLLTISGPTPLKGESMYVPDLRGGAALVLSSLISVGTSYLDNISLILRGYEDIVEKLTKVGAKIEIIE